MVRSGFVALDEAAGEGELRLPAPLASRRAPADPGPRLASPSDVSATTRSGGEKARTPGAGFRVVFPFLRLGRVLATAPARPRIGFLDESVLTFRVLPGDLDQNKHLNNGRYLTMMDLGRFDLLARAGCVPQLIRRKWHPVVTAATIRYRRSLDPFQKYELRTRLLAWDDTGFYIEQRFVRDGSVLAIGVVKGLFLGPEGKLAPQAVAHTLAPGVSSPGVPEWILAWNRSQELLSAALATNTA